MFIVCAMYQKSQEHAHKQLPHMFFWTHTNFCNLYHQTCYFYYRKNTFGHFCWLWDDQIELSTYCFHLTWLWYYSNCTCIQYALTCIQPVNSVMLQVSNLYDYFSRRKIYYHDLWEYGRSSISMKYTVVATAPEVFRLNVLW